MKPFSGSVETRNSKAQKFKILDDLIRKIRKVKIPTVQGDNSQVQIVPLAKTNGNSNFKFRV